VFRYFWSVNASEIRRIFGPVGIDERDEAFFYLRNNNTAGILLGELVDETTFRIDVDYVTPPYRDFRIGQHVIAEKHLHTRLPRVTRLVSDPGNEEHQAYLRRLGFVRDSPEGPLVRDL